MTSPRTPRQWNAGDAEPEDRPVLRDHAPGAGFVWETPLQREGMWGNDYGQWMPWAKVLEHYGPLSEVLPETPEPPQEDRQLLDWIVPDHIGCVETDGYVEITCRAVAGECSQTTSVQNREWIEEFLTKHAHGQPVKRCPVPASQSVPAVPVSSTGGADSGEDSSDAQGATEVDWTEEPRFADFREAYDYATIHFSAAIRAHAKVDRREAYQIWHTIQLGMEKIQRERSPLADSETEWGLYLPRESRVLKARDEDDARRGNVDYPDRELRQRRAPGPWIEVTS